MNRRGFAIVAALAGLLVVAAVLVTGLRDQPSETASLSATRLFPGLVDRVNEVRSVIIRHAKGQLTLERREGGWGVAERSGFPARAAKVRETILAIADLEGLEPKTRNPERYGDIDVDDPETEGSRSRELLLLDEKGQLLAEVIVGKHKVQVGGKGGTYVRVAGNSQAWLARGRLAAEIEARDWIEREVADIRGDGVARVSVRHPDGETLVAERASRDEKDFKLRGLGVGETVKPITLPGEWADLFQGLQATDVARGEELPFATAKPITVELATFEDGLTLTAELLAHSGKDWLRILSAKGGKDGAGEALAARTRGWAFEIPTFKASSVKKRRAELVEKAGGKK